MTNLDNLKRLTKELAEEVEYQEHGIAFKFIKLILDSIKSPAFIITREYDTVYLNPTAIKMAKKYGISTELGVKCYNVLFHKDEPCKECPVTRALKTRRVENTEWKSPLTGKKYMVTDIPLLFNGVAGVIEILNPINRVKNNVN